MSGGSSWRIELPVGMPLLTSNQQRRAGHWSKYYAIIRNIRRETNQRACKQRIPKNLPKVKIKAIYHPPDNRRRDPDAIAPSLKAAIDGIVDSGVIKDDNNKIVTSIEIVSGTNIKKGQLVIIIEENDGGRFCPC